MKRSPGLAEESKGFGNCELILFPCIDSLSVTSLRFAKKFSHDKAEIQQLPMMNSSLSEVSRPEMPVFLRQCHSRDFGKALLNETDHRSMGIDPMVVLGKSIFRHAIWAAKPGKSGRILAGEADARGLRIEKGA